MAGVPRYLPLGLARKMSPPPALMLGAALEPPPQSSERFQVRVVGEWPDQEVRVLRLGLSVVSEPIRAIRVTPESCRAARTKASTSAMRNARTDGFFMERRPTPPGLLREDLVEYHRQPHSTLNQPSPYNRQARGLVCIGQFLTGLEPLTGLRDLIGLPGRQQALGRPVLNGRFNPRGAVFEGVRV